MDSSNDCRLIRIGEIEQTLRVRDDSNFRLHILLMFFIVSIVFFPKLDA